MAIANSSLRFETTQRQSLWTPGAATELRIDSGDALLWNPGSYSKPLKTGTFLGFGAEATFYISAKFGLQAYANLGDGGSFAATYDIDVAVDLPGAVVTTSLDPTSTMTFTYDYDKVTVARADIDTVGFGNSLDPDVPIGAGLDLIVQVDTGLRDIKLINPFKDVNLGGFSFINIDERISLFSVDPLSPLFELELTDGVTLFGRLPTGANIEGQSFGSTVVEGDGFSDTKFLELEADLDALLVRLLDKIPLPPVKVIARFLGDVVFAEHTFDPNDYISAIPKGKIEFNFTMLDITASAGLVVTEDVRLDIAGENGVTPYLRVHLESASTGQEVEGVLGLANETALVLNLTAPASGIGVDEIVATYSIEEAEFFHGVGIGISASITITVLAGNLSGDWVPSALRFSFGPLAEVEIPEGGLNIDLGNFYEDTFTLADDAFNTVQDTYEVFYTDVKPLGWNQNDQGAEQELFRFAQAVLKNVAATQAEYSQSGYSNVVVASAASTQTINTPNTLYVWQGTADNDITLGTNNGSLFVADIDPDIDTNNRGYLTFNNRAATDPVFNWYYHFDTINSFNGSIGYVTPNGTTRLTINQSANMVGGTLDDYLAFYGGDADFFDGKGQTAGGRDVFVANFVTSGYANTAINLDFFEAVNESEGTQLDLDGHIVTIRNVESLAIRTGTAADRITTGLNQDVIDTGAGDDVVDIVADRFSDLVLLGNGDDVATYAFELGTATNDNFEDRIYGGTGFDHAYVTTGSNGLRYDIIESYTSFNLGIYAFGRDGIGWDATHAEMVEFRSIYFGQYTSLSDRVNLNSINEINADQILLINGSEDLGAVNIFADIESLNIQDGGAVANDLIFFTGGTSYDGGLGNDTLFADFEVFNAVSDDPQSGGVYLNVEEGGGFFGNVEFRNFERLDVYGTNDSDVLIGGAFVDYLDGGDLGDDVIYGGDDSVADVIFAKAGNDTVKWGNDGADLMDGGAGTDALLIEADGTETSALRLTFRDTSFNVPTGSDAFWYAYDSASLLLTAMTDAQAVLNGTGILGVSMNGSFDFARAFNFEKVDIVGSQNQDDLLMYLDGTSYIGGEKTDGTDRDVFVADFSDQSVGIQLDLHSAIGAASDTGSLLTNGVFVSGLERAVIKAGSANDTLIGGARDDYFDGGAGADIFLGHEGNNDLLGGAGDDVFYYMGTGTDTIDGGAGHDNLIIGYAGSDITGTPGLEVGVTARDANGDALTASGELFNFSSNTEVLSVARGIMNGDAVSVSYRYQDENVTYSGIEVVDVAGINNQNDLIFYQNGEGYVGGEGSNAGDVDHFAGDFSAFDDDLYFSARGASGENQEIGQGTTIADFEKFTLELGAGNDEVIGGRTGDHVIAGAGDDYFDGGLGADYFEGGAGDDTYVHTGGEDRVFMGDGEHDTVNIGGLTSLGGINGAMGFNVGNQFGGFGGGDTLQNASGTLTVADFSTLLAELEAEGFHQRYQYATNTTSFSIVAVDAEHMDITGSDFNDVLVSGTRDSTLVGGAGDDFLVSYNDEVTLLSGGVGADTYVILGQNNGLTVIADEFDVGSRIHFDAFTESQLQIFAGGNDLFVSAYDEATDGAVDVRIIDYFSNGSTTGLNFEFSTSDNASFFVTPSFVNPTTRIVGTTVNGTTGDEDLAGETNNSDTFNAREGNDVIMGSLGGDIINGGLGSDGVSYISSAEGVSIRLFSKDSYGGQAEGDVLIGVEQIYATAFDDDIAGDHTDNTFYGDAGRDFLSGEAGDDRLFGGLGDDGVAGGIGNDDLNGEEGDDEIYGDEGNDHLSGGEGGDMLFGGADDDVLDGGEGRNQIFGEEGDDFHLYSGGIDLYDGGLGSDTSSYSNFEFGVQVDLGGGLVTTSLSEEFDANTDPVVLARLSNVENAIGTAFGDRLIGDAGMNRLSAGDGDDVLVGGASSDGLDGGTGFDIVDYASEDGTNAVTVDLSGIVFDPLANGFSAGTRLAVDTFGTLDVLTDIEGATGTALNDGLYGDAQANGFYGNAGDDTIYGSAGNDILEGGSGNDFLVGDGFGGSDIEDNDILRGDAGNDSLYGSRGNDRLDGGADDDELFGGTGDDFLTGGLGTDSLDGGTGVNIADYRLTTQGVVVNTFGATDTVTGAEVGTDSLVNIYMSIGGRGNDTFNGGGDDDVFGHYGARDPDTGAFVGGLDTFNGGTGTDFVQFDFFDAAIEVDLSATISAVRSNGTGDLSTGGLFDVAQLSNIEGIRATDYADSFQGVANDFGFLNYFDGRGGDDLIEGGAGSQNELYGGAGNDTFKGFINTVTVDISLFDGGRGFDVIDFSHETNDVNFSLETGDSNDTIRDIEGLIGGSGSDILYGNALNNVFQTGAGDDDVSGLAGADLFVYDSGTDVYDGGSGSDTVDLSNQTVGYYIRNGIISSNGTTQAPDVDNGDAHTEDLYYFDVENFIGTDMNDIIFGDDEDNLFNDGLGDDIVDGGAGDDLFTYGGGTDEWNGGDGEDGVNFINYEFGIFVSLTQSEAWTSFTAPYEYITGQEMLATFSGIENVTGSMFGDVLEGDSGDNQLVGLAGDDEIQIGHGGSDIVILGEGLDTVSFAFASADSDVVFDLAVTRAQDTGVGIVTVTGAENIGGSYGNDTLYGDSGDNVISLLNGDDSAFGRDGNDRFTVGFTFGTDVGYKTLDGGDGSDTLDMSDAETAVRAVMLARPGQGIYLRDGQSFETGTEADYARLTSVENFVGSRFRDYIQGDDDDNILEGHFGADEIHGEGGQDTASYAASWGSVAVDLEAGTASGGHATGDTFTSIENLLGSVLDDTLSGDTGENRIEGAGGNDVIDGRAGDDILAGGEGNDTVSGGAGQDAISGGDGADMLDGGDDADFIFGDAGDDTIEGGDGDDSIEGGLGNDTITAGAGADIVIETDLEGGGDDVIFGNAGDDKLFGGIGNDTLNGNSDNDILVGGLGDDILNGGNGIDLASYEDASGGVNIYLQYTGLDTNGAGVDTLNSIEGVIGSAFQDRLVGTAFDNILKGGNGADILKGKGGTDTFHGGEGDDRIVGGSGNDTMFGDAGSDILFALSGLDVLHGGDDDDFLYGGRDADTLNGDDGADRLRGNIGGDTLNGGAGDDDLRGGGNGDILRGGDGDDFVMGENGSDQLSGGTGNDVLIGGQVGVFDGVRDDFFYFTEDEDAGGFDRIRDFEDNVDKLNMREAGFEDFTEFLSIVSDSGSGLRIDFGSGDVLFVENYSLAQLDSGDVLL